MTNASKCLAPEIYVISLAHATVRRNHMRSQLELLQLRYQLFNAIDMAQTDTLPFRHHDQDQFFLQTGRRARTEEIGCFASHVALWRRCVQLKKPIIILEDDAKLSDDFYSGLTLVNKTIDTLGFIRLQANPKRGSRKVATNGRHAVHFNHRYPFGAMAYAISPATAATFIEKSTVFYAPLDKFIKNFWDHKQALFSLYPPIVDESEVGRESMIGERERLKSGKGQRWRRFAFRVSEYFKRALFVWQLRLNELNRLAARLDSIEPDQTIGAARMSRARQTPAKEGTSIRPAHPV